jgi:hypothetical protein
MYERIAHQEPACPLLFLEGVMAGEDRSRSEQIRALIEEVDRVRGESERMTSHVDRSMKNTFWPDRRRSPRVPSPSDRCDRGDDAD